MPALSFQARFVSQVESGDKTHTIRADRARAFRKGDYLYLYTGMRTKACRKLFEAVCTEVQGIRIIPGVVSIDGGVLAPDELHQLAIRDGFADVQDFMAFWQDRFPFSGQIIHWLRCA